MAYIFWIHSTDCQLDDIGMSATIKSLRPILELFVVQKNLYTLSLGSLLGLVVGCEQANCNTARFTHTRYM